ncbi:phage tail tape measure protein [Alkalibaculum sp. M08DMB]|uniref:Phage tail tape measure protein n=1 Tax=Alkalibaculum sporogenes TaxID=2655001 RepID=A0A6A7KA30_9FIRM|nr:phage tail tape measure protein [Alkalibaculum sporogenes]MPW26399.1 phage tail tape measure protein [Alkalibaculum sporogenes]
MAGDLKRVGLEFKADGTADFRKSIKAVTQDMQELTSAYQLEKAQLDKNTSTYDKLALRLQFVQDAYDSYADKVNILEDELVALENAENRNETAIQKKRTELNNAKRQMEEYGKSIGEVSKKMKTANWTDVANDLDKIGKNSTAAGKKMSIFTAGAIAGGIKITGMASDLQETMSKTDVIFGDSANSVKEWSESSIEDMGLAQQTALDMVATYGDMGTSMDISTDKAADMGKELTKRAADLSSFKNIKIDVANTALNAIYTGETESLKKLGVVMTQANLEQFAMAQGAKESYKEMTEAEKVMLRYEYVMTKTNNAAGDFANTSDGFANSQRIMSESFKEMATELGEILLPYMTKLVQKVTEVIQWFSGLDSSIKTIVLAIIGVVAAIGPLLIIFGAMASGLSSIITLVTSLSGASATGATGITGLSTAFTSLLAPIVAIIAIFAAVVLAFKQLWNTNETFKKAMIVAWDSIKDTLKKIWETVIQPIFNSIKEVMLMVWNKGIKPLWDSWVKFVGGIMVEMARLWTSIKPIVDWFISVFGPVLTAVFQVVSKTFGGIVIGIIGVAGSLLESLGTIISSIIGIFRGLIDFISGVFTGDWSRAWNGIKDIFGNIMKGLGALIKAPLNGVISLINGAIRGLNKISVKIPSWVPGLGGKNFGVNIPRIPMLADGGYLYGGAAIVGEAGAELLTQQGSRTRVTPLNGSGGNTDLIDYNKMARAFASVMSTMAMYVDENGVAKMVDKRMIEVMT